MLVLRQTPEEIEAMRRAGRVLPFADVPTDAGLHRCQRICSLGGAKVGVPADDFGEAFSGVGG